MKGNNMEYVENNDVLTIRLPRRISMDNKAAFDSEFFAVPVFEDRLKEIVLDATDLQYISSSGLRSILSFSKRHPLPLRITELNPMVYEIFSTTGFTELFHVEKALRRIQVEGLKELGRGMYGAVYSVNDEQILKVFYGMESREDLEARLKTVQTAFVKSIPTIIPFETVHTEMGLGLLFEMLYSESLADMVHKHPEQMEEYAIKMAELAQTMAHTHFEEGSLRSRSEMLKSEFASASFLPSEMIAELQEYIDLIPNRDTAVHGDFHARNVMLLEGEPVLIDMDDFSTGHPIWDIACLYRVYPYLISLDQAKADRLFDLNGKVPYDAFYYQVMHFDRKEVPLFWELFLKEYFKGFDEENVKRFMKVAEFYSDLMVIRFVVDRCRPMANQPDQSDLLSAKIGLIEDILSRMRQYDIRNLVTCLEEWR